MKKKIISIIIGLTITAIIAGPVSALVIPSFERGLKLGMIKQDVKWLQVLLNRDPDTRVANSGPGSPGNETSFFGSLTRAAVVRFQEKYSEDVLAPWGFISGTGFVGRTTREKLNTIANRLSDVSSRINNIGNGIPITFRFERSLKLGANRQDVKWLQVLLNRDPDTRVANSGPGSLGNETSFFGSLTRAAVVRFQEKYSEDVLAPWGFISGTGFVGRTTRQKLNAIAMLRVPQQEENLNRQEDALITESRDGLIVERIEIEKGLTVSLAVNNPASTTLISGQALAPLARLTFTNGDDKEIKITQLRLKRLGISADATLSSVYLFEEVNRLTDGNSISSGTVVFNDASGIFRIPAGSSKTIIVYSNIATGVTIETVGISIDTASDITSDASGLNAIFPINGNLMKIASGTLAGVDFNTTTTPVAVSINPQNDYTIWQNIISITVREVDFKSLSLRKIGSIDNSSLRNFRIYINGLQAGPAVESLDSNDYITFDLSAYPQRLMAEAKTIKVLADIVGGSSKTFYFSMRNVADAIFTDIQYDANVLSTANTSAFSARSTGIQTVNVGTATIVQRSDGPVDVVNGVSGETLGEFMIRSASERIKIESLRVEVIWVEDSDSTTVGYLRNATILANNVVIASSSSLDVDRTSADSSDSTTFNFGSSLIIEPGESVYLDIKADIFDNDGTNNLQNDDTLQVNILIGSGNAIGLSSNSSINVPSSAVTGQTVEIEQGELDLLKYGGFVNKTLAVPINNAKIAQFSLMSSHEPVDLDTIIINLETAAGAVDASDDLSNLYLVLNGSATNIKSAVVDGDNIFTINHRLEKHIVLDIEVYADVSLSAYTDENTTDSIIVRARVSGASVESGASAVTPGSATYKSGQTITFGKSELGDLITRFLEGDNLPNRIAAGSSEEEITQGNPRSVIGVKYRFTAVEDDFLLKKIKLKLDDFEKISDYFEEINAADRVDVVGAILYVVLKDGDEIVRDKNGNESIERFGAGTGGKDSDIKEIEFTGLEILIPANTSKILTFELLLAKLNSDGFSYTSQSNLQLRIEKIKYENSLGEEIEDEGLGGRPKGNHLYVYKSIPYFTSVDISENKIYNGTSTNLYSFNVEADYAGDVSLKQLKFALNWDNNNSSTLALDTFRLKRDSQEITGMVTIQDILGNSVESTTNTVTPSHTMVIFSFDDEETIPAGENRTYDIYARPTGFQYSSTNGADTLAINLRGGNDTSSHNETKRYLVDNSSTGLFELHTTNSGDGTAYDLIWSDNSSIRHSFAANNAYPDWANSYLMPNLPLDARFWHGQ